MRYYSITLITLFLTIYLTNNRCNIKSEKSTIKTNSKNQQIDFVPNEETAIKVAEAIWLPIFGESIYDKKPFRAKLVNNEIWVVEGTLEEGLLGGVPLIEIQKSDCKILKVEHGK